MNENATQIPRTQALLLFFHFLHEYKPKARKTRSGEFEFVWKNTRVIWVTLRAKNNVRLENRDIRIVLLQKLLSIYFRVFE